MKYETGVSEMLVWWTLIILLCLVIHVRFLPNSVL